MLLFRTLTLTLSLYRAREFPLLFEERVRVRSCF